jgi:signal transduction histidine kinase
MNLVMNASEAIGDQDGMIQITTQVTDCSPEQLRGAHPTEELLPGSYVCIEVRDCGPSSTV